MARTKPSPKMNPQYAKIPTYQISMVREGPAVHGLEKIENSLAVVNIARQHLKDNGCEQFAVMTLDTRNRPTGIFTVSTGSMDSSLVHPREVFGPALVGKASALILMHNHPSGDPKPSQEDNRLTSRLQDGCILLGLRLLDHIIIGDGTSDFFSYTDKGKLPPH